jgi:hypothetical protein
MSYDRRRHRVVLFGGCDALGSSLADTWEWDGTNWTRRIVLSSPPARLGGGLAYDPVRQRSVLFGGSTGPGYLADTWEWDGANWTQRTPSLSPPARVVTGFFFEPRAARIVLSGGYGFGNPLYLTDRWEWDGASWRCSYAAASTPFTGAVLFDPVLGEEVLVGGAPASGYSFFEGPRVYRGGATGKYLEIVPAATVPPRRSHAMAYDMSRARTVLFGGLGDDPTSPLADTWEWDGQRWMQPSPAVVPPARSGHRMAYDMVRQRVVMFTLADTWEWDGTAWHQVATSGPPARINPAMAFDVTRGVTLLFGGQAGVQAFLDDLWEWNGAVWSQRMVPTGPSPRHSAAMVCDIARGEMLMYGGFVPGSRPDRDIGVDETWILNAAGWRQVRTAHAQSLVPLLVYDQQRFRSLLIGSQVWSWNGADWQEAITEAVPEWPGVFAAVYDTNRHRTVLFGGGGAVADATWELGPRGVEVGPGCPGSTALVPLFSIASPPRLGGGYRATLAGLLPSATFAVVIAGASDTTSPLGPLPIDLASLGMPGCMLAVSPDQFTVVAVQAGHAEYIVQVPDAPALVGLSTSDQAACPDPGANALGVTLSNAVRATVEW